MFFVVATSTRFIEKPSGQWIRATSKVTRNRFDCVSARLMVVRFNVVGCHSPVSIIEMSTPQLRNTDLAQTPRG